MRLTFELLLPCERDALFEFHSDPAHLEVLMRGFGGFRLVRHGGSVLPGSETITSQRVAGLVPITLGFRHTLYEPPERFGEELFRGPFAHFRHVHEFEVASGGSQLVDHLDLALPPYLGGEVATRCFVAPSVRRFFAHRHAVIARLVADGRVASTRGE